MVEPQLSPWNVRDAAGKLTASPLLIVLLVVNVVQIHELPALEASIHSTLVTVPQPADGVGKLMAPLLLVVPPVPELAVVLAADCVPAQFARLDVTATRA